MGLCSQVLLDELSQSRAGSVSGLLPQLCLGSGRPASGPARQGGGAPQREAGRLSGMISSPADSPKGRSNLAHGSHSQCPSPPLAPGLGPSPPALTAAPEVQPFCTELLGQPVTAPAWSRGSRRGRPNSTRCSFCPLVGGRAPWGGSTVQDLPRGREVTDAANASRSM